MFAGLLLGLGFVLLAERRNRRVWRADEITDLHGLTVLAEIDVADTRDGRLEAGPRASTELSHLANVIRARSQPGGLATSLGGASAGDLTGWIAAQLALTLCRSGDRVALVSASPEPAVALTTLNVTPRSGLAEVLTGARTVSDALVGVKDAASLTVIGVGPEGALAPEWLNSAAMRDLVAELDQRNTFVVLESVAVPVSGDAQAMAALADLALVVVELGTTTPDELAAAARAVDAVGTPLLGAVVVRRRRRTLWRRIRRQPQTEASAEVVPAVPQADGGPPRQSGAARAEPSSTAALTGRNDRPASQPANASTSGRTMSEPSDRRHHGVSPTRSGRR
jgi:hypothetical protein